MFELFSIRTNFLDSLNLTSDKMSQESPSAKLRKNGPKYDKFISFLKGNRGKKKKEKCSNLYLFELFSIRTNFLDSSYCAQQEIVFSHMLAYELRVVTAFSIYFSG